VPVASTATGVEPVVSMAMPFMAAAAEEPAFFQTVFNGVFKAFHIVQRVLPELVF